MLQKTIPIHRIFDVAKAKEFDIDWLDFKIEFEHQFEENTPYYVGIKRDNMEIHLSEHHGDATPGRKVLLFAMRLKNILMYCSAGHINIIDLFGKNILWIIRVLSTGPV